MEKSLEPNRPQQFNAPFDLLPYLLPYVQSTLFLATFDLHFSLIDILISEEVKSEETRRLGNVTKR